LRSRLRIPKLGGPGHRLGYGEIPLTACYEWIGRPAPELGLRAQAEWYARDCLLVHAFHFHRINSALLYDVSNSYYHSPWGTTGLLSRYPALVPRPSYVALATVTQVLDGARVVGSVPTGSLSLYAMEFETSQGRTYALWTPRGTRQVTFRFAGDTELAMIDLWGRERRMATRGAAVEFSAGTAPVFVRSPLAVRSIAAGAWS